MPIYYSAKQPFTTIQGTASFEKFGKDYGDDAYGGLISGLFDAMVDAAAGSKVAGSPITIAVTTGLGTLAGGAFNLALDSTTIEVDGDRDRFRFTDGGGWIKLSDGAVSVGANFLAGVGIAAAGLGALPAIGLTVGTGVLIAVGQTLIDAGLKKVIEDGVFQTSPKEIRLFVNGDLVEGHLYEGGFSGTTKRARVEAILRASETEMIADAEITSGPMGRGGTNNTQALVEDASIFAAIAGLTGLDLDEMLALAIDGSTTNASNYVDRYRANDLYYTLTDGQGNEQTTRFAVEIFDENGRFTQVVNGIVRDTGRDSEFIFGNVELGDDLTYVIIGDGSGTMNGERNVANVMLAGDGDSRIVGGSLDDYIYGGWGQDTISASWGNDYVSGGLGNDTYELGARKGGAVTLRIDDLMFVEFGNGDLATLENVEFAKLGSGDDVIEMNSFLVPGHAAYNLHYHIDAGDGFNTFELNATDGIGNNTELFVTADRKIILSNGTILENIDRIDFGTFQGYTTVYFETLDWKPEFTFSDSNFLLNLDFSQLSTAITLDGNTVSGGGKSLNFSDTPRLDVQGTNQLDTVREINDNYFAPGTGGATLENTRFGLPYDGGDIQIDGTNLLFFDFYLPLDYDLSRLSFAQQNIVRHYYLDRNDRLVYDQWTHDIVVTVPDLGTILIEDLTTRKEIFGGSRFRLDFYAFDLDATRTLLTAIVPPDAESQEFRESTTEFTYEGGLNFSGGPGNDIIAARSDGPHSYDLGNGDDTFISLDINSSAYGGAGDDAFFGGTAFDFFTGDAGDDDFYATVGGDVYVGGAGEDTLHWASDTALITSGPDTRFYGGGGSDTVLIDISSVDLTLDMGQELGRRLNFLREFEDSELGADNYIAFRELGLFLWDVEEIRVTLDGSAANIFYDRQGTGASDLIFNDAGRSEISGRGGNDIIYGDALGDRLGGGAGEDLIFGLDGNDTVEGDAGFDYLYGGDGNDTLEGGDDTDYLYGGRGDDLFVMGRDADFSDGGDGVDTVSYADAGGGIELYVTRPLDNGGWAVGDSFSQVEILLGSDHDDTIHLGLERIEVQGRGGSDRIVAGAGDAVVFGGSGRDFLTGGSGENWLDGGTGADVFFGGLGRDTYAGGQGTDTVSYAGAVAGVTADLAQPQGNGGVATGDYYLSIENLNGSGRGDTLSGDHKGNVIRGLGGGDTIYGGAGRDTVIGGSGGDEIYSGSGWDEMTGGSGNDWFYFQKGDGRDRITDFEDGADRLFFDSAFGTRAEILARASQVDGDVVFNLGNDKLTLELTDIALIGEADILFI